MPMIILGLDPGIARTGFGVLDAAAKNMFVRCGCIVTDDHLPLPERLTQLALDLTKLLRDARPDLAVVEQIFFGTNRKTAFATAQARGVILHIVHSHHVPIESLTPLQIKSRLTGFGAADKQQVQNMVRSQLRLTRAPQSDDAADALAAALCFVRQ